tara:strand:+ start:1293 stop:1832 length:540 start_codon:yes stop_codon:yes gene_type:complete
MFLLYLNNIQYPFNFNTKKEAVIFLLEELERNDVEDPFNLIKNSKKKIFKSSEKVFVNDDVYTFKFLNCDVFSNYEKCNICYNSMFKQHSLVCNHYICKSCVANLRKLECPMCRQELKGKIVTDEVFAKIVQNMEEDKYQEEMENYRSAAILQDPLPDIFNEVEFPVLDILDILNNIRN